MMANGLILSNPINLSHSQKLTMIHLYSPGESQKETHMLALRNIKKHAMNGWRSIVKNYSRPIVKPIC